MGVAHEWLVKLAWKAFRKTVAFKRANPLMLRWVPPRVHEKDGETWTWKIAGVPKYSQDETPFILIRTKSDVKGRFRVEGSYNIPNPIICTVTVRCVCPFGHEGSCSIWPTEKQRREIERRRNKRTRSNGRI